MDKKLCPRCNRIICGHTALSRVDNSTKICESCGTDEAIIDASFLTNDLKLTKDNQILRFKNKVEMAINSKSKLPKNSLQYKHYNKIINTLTKRIEQIENSK